MERNKAWKDRGIQQMLMPPGLMAQLQDKSESVVEVAITSLCQGGSGQVFYALEAGDVGGLFAFYPKTNRENRLFHHSEFRIGHLSYERDRQLIACAVQHPTGVSNVATLSIDGVRPIEVTEGDSIDLAPRWIPGQRKAFVYQSAGIGRNSEGFVRDRAAFTIEKLNFETQEITTLAADPKSDLLAPQIDQSGLLYYIRRPYRARSQSLNLLQWLKEILLMPVRLLYAVFQWLNFFTRLYTGKPLLTAVTKQQIDHRSLQAWGDWVTPALLKDRNMDEPDAPSLVPRNWKLVRQSTQGMPEILAEGVLAYDIAPDGTIFYTNGSAIYRISSDGDRERILVGNWIETVTILDN